MLALQVLWQKVVRPIGQIVLAFQFIEFIIGICKKISEVKEGLRAVWPIGITVAWTLGSTLWIVGGGALQGFFCAIIAIPLAEWPIIFVLTPMRLLHLQRLSLFSAAERAKAYLDDGNAQVTLSFVGSLGGMIFVIVNKRGMISHVINAPAAFEMDQLSVYLPGLAIILMFFSLGVKLYAGAVRVVEPYKRDLENRLSGRAAVAVGQGEGAHDPGPGPMKSGGV